MNLDDVQATLPRRVVHSRVPAVCVAPHCLNSNSDLSLRMPSHINLEDLAIHLQSTILHPALRPGLSRTTIFTPSSRGSPKMPTFQSKKFRSSSYDSSIPAKYRALLARHPFALFGLPFIATMLLGSFFLTPATALRYERHDRKVRQMTKEEELGIGANKRKIDLKEEYYVRTYGRTESLKVSAGY